MNNAVTRLGRGVKYVKSSQGRKQSFEKMIKEVGISCDKRPPLDVATRWNFTYKMLKCALEYEKAFESLTREDIILDPRFKLGFLEFRLSKCFGKSSQYFPIVEKTFRGLFGEYNSQSSDDTQDYAKSNSSVETYVGRTNPWANWSLHQNLNQRRRVSELDKYLEEETIPTDAPFDILQYWKTSSATYPILARMARDILAVPASTVASESAFSSGEKIINNYRSRLTSKTVEALICLQDWIRGKGNDNITQDEIAGYSIGDDQDDET
ncbi:hypothetical protein C2845_PM14G05940 [Panicum miliaceum]|uniref:HAT C-terminal dimerisation domain-containing protein n=1 Tax=Panicum miliaceum TaxID=4540 RepID=A0A3L6PMV6_PANMI|nr:hypothetical protein C2845_PM14G05940 [Panicum miliaceum]